MHTWYLHTYLNLDLDQKLVHLDMCGIHVVVCPVAATPPTTAPHQTSRLRKRGPDHVGCERVSLCATWIVSCTSTVLALRGDHTAQQPLVGPDRDHILCWNGEAWRFRGHVVPGNDGDAIFDRLRQASGATSQPGRTAEAVLDVLRAIEGPFAFVFLHRPSQTLFFGRDRLGRRSLLLSLDDETPTRMTLSSIAESCSPAWQEVAADGIYAVSLSCPAGSNPSPTLPRPVRYVWLPPDEHRVSEQHNTGSTKPSRGDRAPSSASQTYSCRF